MLKSFLLFFTAILLIASCAVAQTGPKDLGFEGVKISEDHGPQKWFGPKKEYSQHYKVEIVSTGAYKGKDCAEIQSTGTPTGNEFGNIMQFFDATPFRGKTVRFRAAVRVESSNGGQAQMWMRVDKKEKAMGFFDNMDDRPITSKEWKEYDITGVVDPDAENVYIGCMLIGEGKVYVDAVNFEILTGKDALPVPVAHNGPSNLDFEEAKLSMGYGHGWFPPQKKYTPDYEVKLVSDGAYKGKQCVELHSTGKPSGKEFGNIMQSFDAIPFRGKTVRFRGAVRIASVNGGRAQMWIRADRKNQQMGFFDNMQDRPITSSAWKEYDITGTIDTDAVDIYIGCMLIGEGKANFDAVSFEIVDEHPPASSLDADRKGWIRAGSNPTEYKMELQDKPYGSIKEGSSYIAKIQYTAEGEPSGFGTYMKMYPPGQWAGKELKMTGYIKTENVVDWCGMWCRIDGADGKEVMDFDNMQDRPIKGNTDWKKYEITINIPKDASAIAYGVLVSGKGTAYFKDIAFEVLGDAKPARHFPGKE